LRQPGKFRVDNPVEMKYNVENGVIVEKSQVDIIFVDKKNGKSCKKAVKPYLSG
jgi:hypothetical protein